MKLLCMKNILILSQNKYAFKLVWSRKIISKIMDRREEIHVSRQENGIFEGISLMKIRYSDSDYAMKDT